MVNQIKDSGKMNFVECLKFFIFPKKTLKSWEIEAEKKARKNMIKWAAALDQNEPMRRAELTDKERRNGQ